MGQAESNESAAVKRQAEGGSNPMYELLDLAGKNWKYKLWFNRNFVSKHFVSQHFCVPAFLVSVLAYQSLSNTVSQSQQYSVSVSAIQCLSLS